MPAGVGVEEVPIRGAEVPGRRHVGATSQHELVGHELAVVLADGAVDGAEAGVGVVGALCPLPERADRSGSTCLGPDGVERVAGAELSVGRVVVAEHGLPLGLAWQPEAGPAGEGVGLVVGDVAERLFVVDRMLAVEVEAGAPIEVPVVGRGASGAVAPTPAVRQPERRLVVAAVGDELTELAAGDRLRGDAERLEPGAMSGRLVVEREAVAGVADVDEAAVVVQPTAGMRGGGDDGRVRVGRREGMTRQQMEGVHQDQLLVLLLVVDAELDQVELLGGRVGIEQSVHRLVDVVAVVDDPLVGWPGQQAALGPRLTASDRLVVAVEQVRELVVEGRLVEHEGLEEPGGVTEVPLRGAGVGHRLHDLVLERQRGGQRRRRAAHVGEALPQVGAPVGGGGVDDRHALLLEVAPSGWRVG